MGDGGTRRRRRSPAEAEREILESAERFLRERPLRELTIDEVMAGTGLSRPAFYVYFRDRPDLGLRLIGEIGGGVVENGGKGVRGGGLLGGVAGGWAGRGQPSSDWRSSAPVVCSRMRRQARVFSRSWAKRLITRRTRVAEISMPWRAHTARKLS